MRITDLNLNHEPGGDPVLIAGHQAIKIKIYNILMTLPGELVNEPTFGSKVQLRVFEPLSPKTAYRLESDVFEAIETWMSNEITLDRGLTSIIADENDQSYAVNIAYFLNRSNNQTNLKFKIRPN
jgi:phage baseplate assembly protein W